MYVKPWLAWKERVCALFSFLLHWVSRSAATTAIPKEMNTINRSDATRESKSCAIVVLNTLFNGINWIRKHNPFVLFQGHSLNKSMKAYPVFSLLIPFSSSSESRGTSLVRTRIIVVLAKTRMRQSYDSCPLLSLFSLVSASLEYSLQRQSKTSY